MWVCGARLVAARAEAPMRHVRTHNTTVSHSDQSIRPSRRDVNVNVDVHNSNTLSERLPVPHQRTANRTASLPRILPHPRSPGGKPQRLTARVKIASARPYFPQPRFAGGANFRFVCPSVCPWCQSDVPNLGAKAVLVAPSNAETQISPPAEEASM